MRSLIASSFFLASIASASAAPPSSCAGKFIGEWRHSGGNRGSVLADGRALCSEHSACVQGTWTCSGNVLIYTNPVGTWSYTLAPDGGTMSTGSAVSTRLGPVPASARSRDLGAASNVTADVLGIDRTPSAAPPAVAPAAPPKPATAAAANRRAADNPEAEANAKEGRKFFQAGVAAAKRGDWSAAEDDFSVAKERFRSANRPIDTAADNARLAGEKRLRAAAAGRPAPKPPGKQEAGNKPTKENCEQVGYINIAIVDRATTPQQRADLIRDRDRLKAICK